MVTLDPRSGKWLLLALVVSLGLNLFVGGLVLGHRLHREPHGDWTRPQHAENEPRIFGFVGRMASALPLGDRKQFIGAMETYHGELAAADARLRQARQKVRDAMAADPFDRTALENAFADVRTSMTDVQKVLHGALADAVSRLPPAARKDLSEWEPRARDKDRDHDLDKDRDEKR